jgi:hypothetical protein
MERTESLSPVASHIGESKGNIRANASHEYRGGIPRASEHCEEFRAGLAESVAKRAEVAHFSQVRWRNVKSDFARFAGFVETDLA